MPRSLPRLIFWGALILMLAAGGVLAYISSGIYDIAATKQHIAPVYWALTTARRQSIRARIIGETPPADLSDASVAAAGLPLYDQHCRQCHGAPGLPPDAIGLGMMPAPPNFAQMGRDLSAPEIHWAISNGIKLTGMPAWKFRLTESERWALTAFVKNSLSMTPAEYRARREQPAGESEEQPKPRKPEAPWEPKDAAQRGRVAILQYACETCHVIPGIRGPDAHVGPPLAGIAGQVYIAGVLRNTPDHMIKWLRDPQQVDPLSAMPNLGVSENDARDIATYLYALR
ncbi:c-type cytochrome [Microvirga calopogonii]|uniref:c-type cytochrome n=1 Tax=Microvirga calopogonii TaxID=2078013 RepID=UPI000E0DD3F1|nr:c-type cytochrome [Microvirga calopogonii]